MFYVSSEDFRCWEMDPFAMYITHSELPPPVVVPRRKKRLKQLQLELEQELVCLNVVVCVELMCSTYNNVYGSLE